MKQKLIINLKHPIFSWLFFLFLSSGVSNYDNLQFGKPVQIERVDRIISNSGKKKNVAKFSLNTTKSYLPQRLNSQFLRINLLSQGLQKYIHIYLNRQFYLFQSINQNTIPHLRSRNLASHSSDDFPDFIS